MIVNVVSLVAFLGIAAECEAASDLAKWLPLSEKWLAELRVIQFDFYRL